METIPGKIAVVTGGTRGIGHAADVTKVEQVGEFFQAVDREFGGLDILVNNAGEGVFRKVAQMTPEEWHRNIDLNLNGPFCCSREALERFAKRAGDTSWMIAPQNVAAAVALVPGMPARTRISRLEMRPSRHKQHPR